MKRKILVGCTLISIMITTLLSGCSGSNSAFADEGLYRAMNPYVFAGHSVLENYLDYEHTDIMTNNISIEPIIYSDENAFVTDNDNTDMLSLLESSNFFAVRFLPEQVYNPNNIFPFRAVSLESLMSMYRELNEYFDYALMIPLGLGYVGHFDRDVNFIEMPPNANVRDFVNRRLYNADGSVGSITPIRAIGLGRTLYQGFDSGISEGRNLIASDFYKKSPEQAISVVLGYAYKELFHVGDTFPLQMNWQTVNFTVHYSTNNLHHK